MGVADRLRCGRGDRLRCPDVGRTFDVAGAGDRPAGGADFNIGPDHNVVPDVGDENQTVFQGDDGRWRGRERGCSNGRGQDRRQRWVTGQARAGIDPAIRDLRTALVAVLATRRLDVSHMTKLYSLADTYCPAAGW